MTVTNHAGKLLIRLTLIVWLPAVTVSAMTIPDIRALSPDVLIRYPEGVVTGVVTCTFHWQEMGAIVAPVEDPDGPAVYVGGTMPGELRAVLKGADRLSVGDRVRVRGRFQQMLLEPGVVAREIEVLDRVRLPPPQLRPPYEIIGGALNNRRVAVEGVFWGAEVTKHREDAVTVFRVGTSDGPITMHVAGMHPELAALRDRAVHVEGLVLPLINARGEFLSTEVEAFSPESIHPLDANTPAPPPVSLNQRGVLGWRIQGVDGHACRIVGQVVHVDAEECFVVVRQAPSRPNMRALSVRVNVGNGIVLPSVGAVVVATGFPDRADNCGVLEEGLFEPYVGTFAPMAPDALSEGHVDSLLAGQTDQDEDFNYRFVTLTARVQDATRLPERRVALDLRTTQGSLKAVVSEAADLDLDTLVDRPLVRVTGVLDLHLRRSYRGGLHMSTASVDILVQTSNDLSVVMDAAARGRRFRRIAALALQWAVVPLVLVIALAVLRSVRRRELVATLARDRRRIADELHDNLAQQLAGARMMIFAVKSREDIDDELRENLSVAIDALESARGEVRAAVFRLKNDSYLLKSAETLIREGAKALTARGKIRVRSRLCTFPDFVTGDVKHDLLSIVQEAMTNATKHGHAKNLVILGERLTDGGLVLSVLNDGEPFDAASALGVEAGHFGLSSMRERATRSGFALTFGRRGRWTEVRLERRGQ